TFGFRAFRVFRRQLIILIMQSANLQRHHAFFHPGKVNAWTNDGFCDESLGSFASSKKAASQ
ncbi:MAG: hypothetical protein QX198_13475, partial [Methylococcaceae bacterium]